MEMTEIKPLFPDFWTLFRGTESISEFAIMGALLFIIAYLLFLPLTVWNYFLVENKVGYFKSSAISLDKFANREFRTLWNKKLRTEFGYHFGYNEETISSALGKNEQLKTLTKTGKRLVWLLNKLDKNHCIKSIKI